MTVDVEDWFHVQALSGAVSRADWDGMHLRVGDSTAGVLGSAYSLWAIAGAGREAMAWGLILLAAGLPVYWAVRQRSSKPQPS